MQSIHWVSLRPLLFATVIGFAALLTLVYTTAPAKALKPAEQVAMDCVANGGRLTISTSPEGVAQFIKCDYGSHTESCVGWSDGSWSCQRETPIPPHEQFPTPPSDGCHWTGTSCPTYPFQPPVFEVDKLSYLG